MSERRYYSIRTGKNPNAKSIDLPMLRRLFRDLFLDFSQKDYFQEAFGYVCVDAGEVPGSLGTDIEAQIYRKLRKVNLWPIQDKCSAYSEDDLFDIVEFLNDYISKPTTGQYHNYSNCGWHYYEFDKPAGQREFRSEVNNLLRDYDNGFEISTDGEVLSLGGTGMNLLFEANLLPFDPENVESRIQAAIYKFRRHRSSLEDRRDAIRDLADVLEYLRPDLKRVLTKKDESDLFNIANNLGVRHHNVDQQTDYDKNVWYSWMFHYYLATIHAAERLIMKSRESKSK
jgi:hypothetical protein